METNDTISITGGPLKPGEYVLIRSEMTAEDEAWIQDHSATMRGKGRKAKVEVTIGQVKLATLKHMIVGWKLTKTIKDHEGNDREVEIPYSKESVGKLPQRISGYIGKKIDDLNPDWEDEDEEDF